VVEQPPVPVGGLEGLYSTVRKNLKYPKQARHMDVEGKVIVEFIINRDGTPTDIKVIKGIGAGCDEEAKRVIGLTKWNPGKQRGKPVRVKMVMPITFVLN
jgi:protein TonB